MFIAGLILIIAASHFGFKKISYHLYYLQRTKGILEGLTSFTLFYEIHHLDFMKNYTDVLLLIVPFLWPAHQSENEYYQAVYYRIIKFIKIFIVLFILGSIAIFLDLKYHLPY
jgi:hypothetical protein